MLWLTCKLHDDLRWLTKDVAWTRRPDGTGYYNGQRNLFFEGARHPDDGKLYRLWEDGGTVNECKCPLHDLVLAPESIPAPAPETA